LGALTLNSIMSLKDYSFDKSLVKWLFVISSFVI